jgi:hypothetical protein
MEKQAKFKLSAILSADVKAYSRLIGGDQAETGKTLLSKVPYILVIARNPTCACKGQPAMIRQVAEELAVRGSTREVGKK